MRYKVIMIICVLLAGLVFVGLIIIHSFRSKLPYEETLLVNSSRKTIQPCSINDYGQAVGFIQNSTGRYDVVLWDQKNGAKTPTGLGNYQPVNLFKINNNCQIVGGIKDPNNMYRAFLWDPESGLQILDTLSGLMTEAEAINNHGRIAGYSQTSNRLRHAVIWDKDDKLVDLGTLGGSESHAGGINDNGHVVGFSQVASGQWHAFFWDPNTGMKDIGPTSFIWPPGDSIHINNNGLVVGRFGSATDEMLISTWSRAEGIKPVPSLEGIDAFPISLNDAGQFLLRVRSEWLMGLTHTIETYLWTPKHGFIRLIENRRKKQAARFILFDINSKGQILTLSETKESRQRVLLLDPTIEKPSH